MTSSLKLAAVLALGTLSIPAHAATLNLGTITVNVPSTSITCDLPAIIPGPVPANTTLCTFTVLPSNWAGVISNPVGAADSADFAVSAVGGASVLQNTVILTSTGAADGTGNYHIGTVTSTP